MWSTEEMTDATPAEPSYENAHKIVVGIDGSENSMAALEWALAYAAARGGTVVKAIMTWTFPVASAASYPMATGMPMAVDLSSSAEAALDQVLEPVVIPEAIQFEREVLEGPASSVLIDQSRDADLLVIGRRGHGTLLGLLLGSVASQCTHHAECPVVVVPHHDD